MKKIFILIFFLLFFFFSKNQALAVENCSGIVRDSTSTVLPNVSVNTQTFSPAGNLFTTTDSSGKYSFNTLGFGGGAVGISKVLFEKSGYETLIVDTLTNPKCPGNVTLLTPPPANQSGYKCDLNYGCIQVDSNSDYSDIKACSSDCKQMVYNAARNTCYFPDLKWHQQRLECAKIPVTGALNTNPALAPTPTPPPPPPPCKDKGGVNASGNPTTVTADIVSCSTIDTALGFIDTNPSGFVKSIFGIVLSLAGGIALILIMISGYRLMASQGNPEKVKEAQESLTSAIVGLLFIIFSITILQIVGVDILHIPGFN